MASCQRLDSEHILRAPEELGGELQKQPAGEDVQEPTGMASLRLRCSLPTTLLTLQLRTSTGN